MVASKVAGDEDQGRTTVLEHPKGTVHLAPLPSGGRRLTVELHDASVYSPRLSCETSYPVSLVAELLRVKGPAWLCDEIVRDIDRGYVEHNLRYTVLPFVEEPALERRRLLDFGCGAGSSTMALWRLFPRTDIVGVELKDDLLEIARLRAEYYGANSVQLERSPAPDKLPRHIGSFDFIVFSAVYEHLLPEERRKLLPLLWSVLNPGGVVFINELPHRWFALESHTTGLPLINFVPDRSAHWIATRLSRRIGRDASWPQLLRDGIRGGTAREVLRDFSAAGDPRSLKPHRMGMTDMVDLWYMVGPPTPKRRGLRAGLKLVNVVGDGSYAPYLYLAIQKEA